MSHAGYEGTPCRVHVEERAAGALVVLGGDVDHAAHDDLDAAFARVSTAPPGDVTVDLTGTTFLGSAGMGFLVQLYRHATASGHEVQVRRASPQIAHKITLSGLDGVLNVVDEHAADHG
jgi:anti-anti-sigma factor